MPLVSVIIPTYNRANFIGRAIESVLNQTYKKVEIIVVDDGSTDSTSDLIAGYGDTVRYIYKKNGGVSSARNLGIKISKGQFIAFLDSDDEWLPDKLEKQVEFFEKNPNFGMVLCDFYFIDSSGEITERLSRRHFFPKDGYILDDVFIKPYLIPSSVLVKKTVLEDVGYFDESISTAEDLDLHLRIARKYKIGLISEPLAKCMFGHEGLSILARSYDDHTYVLERFINCHAGDLDKKLIRKALFETYIIAAKGKFWNKEWQDGGRYAFKATVQLPSPYSILPLVKILFVGFRCLLYGLIKTMSGERI